MITDTFVLSEKYPDCTLTSYIHEPYAELGIGKRRAVIVCPGGAYLFLSDREGEPVALQFLAAGFNVFVLRYSICEKAADYAPLIESALAVKYVREHAKELYVDPDYVFVNGYSAGGHLAASCGTLWNHPRVKEALDDAPEGIGRPTGTILGYPVISGGVNRHQETLMTICGSKTPTDAQRDEFSLELHVDETTSPSFIWHTATDPVVPVENSLLYASALAKYKVPFELHIFPTGTHGLSLCNKETWSNNPQMLEPSAECWIDMAIRWAQSFKV